jgi:GDP-L-fucose synthase
MDKNSKIYLAGHRGLVGSALLRRLEAEGFSSLLLRDYEELDLTVQADVNRFFEQEKPECVILAAAKVGGILANNSYPADFIRENLLIEAHTIDAAWRQGVKQFLFLGSSCIYPKLAPQPIKEDYLLTGPLEPTNEPYAVAKILGIKMCQAYQRQHGFNAICLMPTNLYGPGDNFNLESSHVLPALIRKFHEAKTSGARHVEIWGTGTPRREFLHVDDLAEAALFLLQQPAALLNQAAPDGIFNVGAGEDIEIRELALLIREISGASCELIFDPNKPDGTPRKLLDVNRIHSLGWKARIPLAAGIRATYQWFQENLAH